MTTDSWRGIRAYQGTHDDLHGEEGDPNTILLDHLDPSCPICNSADTAKAVTFDNFWYLLTTHYHAQSWTNNTVAEFEQLRGALRRYLSSEEDDEKTDAGQKAFHYIRRTLQTIRYTQDPQEDLEDTEYTLVNTGVHSENYTLGERLEEIYQENKLKTARRKGTEGGPSGTTEEDNFQDTRTSQSPIPEGSIAEEQTANPFSQRTATPENFQFQYPIPPTTTSAIVNPHTPGSRPYHPAVPTISGTIVQDDSPEHQEPLNIPGGRPRSASPILPITQSSYRNLASGGNPPPGITTTPNIFGHLGFGLTASTYGQVPQGIFGVGTTNMSQGFGNIGGTQGTGFGRYSFTQQSTAPSRFGSGTFGFQTTQPTGSAWGRTPATVGIGQAGGSG